MTKTVGDIIAELSELDPTLIVGIAKDEEGNGFNAWSGDFSFSLYDPDGEYEEQFSSYTYDLDEDGDEDEDTERPVEEREANSIILWP